VIRLLNPSLVHDESICGIACAEAIEIDLLTRLSVSPWRRCNLQPVHEHQPI
jgi:hypothetical protein